MASQARSIESFASLSGQILRSANQGSGRVEFLRAALVDLLVGAGCDQVELRLRERDQFIVGRLAREQESFEYRLRS